jgi:hypothetical protein
MAFFGSIASALIGAKSSKMKTAANGLSGIFGGSQTTSDKPIATDHKHSSDSSKEERRNEALSLRPDPSFMGKGQVENFSSLTAPESVDRSGRAVSSQELDPVGIKPAMNPPLATPIDIDQQGVNSLYSDKF